MTIVSPQSDLVPSGAMEQLAAERLIGIDVLRGLAVIAVVLNHTPHYAHGGFRENPWFFPAMLMDLGYLGVPLFVLISGFCIHRRTAIGMKTTGTVKLNWVQFWKKRFWRLYPPYVAAIILSLFCALLLHDRSTEIFSSIVPDLLTHLFLVHNLTAKYPVGLGNGAFWSLGMEEQLYLLYIPLMFFIRRRSIVFAVAIATVTTILWRILITSPLMTSVNSIGGLGMWGMWPFYYWMHWALGALAVDAYFQNCRLPRWCDSLVVSLFAIVAGCLTNSLVFNVVMKTGLATNPLLLAWSPHQRSISVVGELVTVMGFFGLMNWCVRNPSHILMQSRLSQSLARLGRISYSIYLTHVPLLFVLEEHFPLSHSVTDWLIRIIIYPFCCVLMGAFFYWAVERWFLSGRCPNFRTARHSATELVCSGRSSS
jgi:peptidoglycan/LPS O-acetylase OafA/YrhL